MLVKFERYCMVQTTRNDELFDQKNKNKNKNKQNKTKQNKKKKKNDNKKQTKTNKKKQFFKIIFNKALTPFWKTFL